MDIAKKITQLRTDRNLTVNKLANLAGLSQGFVRQIELGEKNPTVESLSLICDALNISLSDFFLETDAPPRQVLIEKLNQNISCLSDEDIIALIKITNSMHKH